MITREEKIGYIVARIRNIIYYRLTVEPSDPIRYRAQYLHVLRNLRKDILGLLGELEPGDTVRRTWLSKVVDIIPPSVKSEFCYDVIRQVNDFVEKNGYINKQTGEDN